MTYKVHLDGDNLLPYLTGQTRRARGNRSLHQRRSATDSSALRQLEAGVHGAADSGTMLIWANPFTSLRVPKMFNLRMDPYERADVTSNTYWDWEIDHVYLLVPPRSMWASSLRPSRTTHSGRRQPASTWMKFSSSFRTAGTRSSTGMRRALPRKRRACLT